MLKPLNDYVLILPDPIEAPVGNTGMEDPEVTADTPVSGIAIDVGSKPSPLDDPISENFYENGMKVWFKMWAGEDIKYKDGKTYKLVHLKDLIAYETD